MQLNKYIAHAGICSRRNAALLIKDGKVLVNGQVMTDPGYRVQVQDVVKVAGKKIIEQKKIYILLNKPKNCVSTVSDEKGRRTVIDLLKPEIKERVYPVGRLDRDTTGLLLLTNDGQLAQQLAHPKYEVKKTYHVLLDRPIDLEHLHMIKKGVRLEDGVVRIDHVRIAPGGQKNKLYVTLHCGKYRVVRRIFERLGYEVIALDRVAFAHLTKRDLPVGMWRFLKIKEIKDLQMNEPEIQEEK